jgi:glycerol-3-phosphate dehydrogenase (NAD(P)+)
MNASTIALLGAGSWGTAVAIHLAHSGHRVFLWGRDPAHLQALIRERENKRYLPGIAFPPSLIPTADLSECLAEAEQTILAVPSHAFSELLSAIPKPAGGLSWLTKGIDPSTHSLLSDLVAKQWGESYPVAVISGPSFANEVARHLPTALVVASNSLNYATIIRTMFQQKTVRAYLSEDLVGIQLCGAIKNVLAIACGISDGLSYGANAKAALITRGLAEMIRLGTAWGANPNTFTGLAGLGDLVLTCTDNQSRNRRFGLLLGQGIDIPEAEKQIGQVVEGKYNADQVCFLATQHTIELPICAQVSAVMQGQLTAKQAAKQLMDRPLRLEE